MNIEIKGEEVFIDGQKYVREPKPDEPEVEEGRLVSGRIIGTDVIVYGPVQYLGTGSLINHEHIYGRSITPVHRRWNELTDDEQNRFKMLVRTRSSTESNYKDAYKLITGEDHP